MIFESLRYGKIEGLVQSDWDIVIVGLRVGRSRVAVLDLWIRS